MRRSSSASRALAVALAVLSALVAVSVGTSASPARAQQAPPADTTGAPEAGAGNPAPLVADFDGDGRSDQLWYGPGAGPDHAWYGKANRSFSGRSVNVGGPYTPLVGDFGGDGRDDVIWYGPGAAADFLWNGTARRGFVGRPLTIGGAYEPFVGDFDGDRRDDVFWYSPSGPDRVWYSTAGGGFVGRKVSVTRPYTPVVGDFDGNGTDDIVWYGPGSARDHLWRGTRSRSFLGVALRVNGDYTPVVGDFGADGHDDVYWHRDGPRSVLWRGRAGGAFEGSSASSAGTTVPFTGDFDGDGADDLGWNDPGTAADRLWFGGVAGFTERAIAVTGTYDPRVGDFDGDGRDDFFWFADGEPRDVLWFSGPGRGFVSRPSVLDPLPGPGVALRQETFANQFNPYGYMAHAMGPTPINVHGQEFGYSNTLEAFQHNYARGFRVFESDWVRLADGTVLAAHDGTEQRYGLPPGVKFSEAVRGQLSGTYKVGGRPASGSSPAIPPSHFTPLFAEDIPALLDAHPDVHLVVDTKVGHVPIVRRFVELTPGRPDLLARILPHVAGQRDLDQMRALYPIRNYVLALYRTQAFNRFDDDAVVDFVRRNRVPAVMMWFGTNNPALSLRDNMRQQRRYSAAFDSRLRAAGAVTYVHSLRDTDLVRSFADRGVGVYSNGPFPPFGIEPAPIEPDTEGAPLV